MSGTVTVSIAVDTSAFTRAIKRLQFHLWLLQCESFNARMDSVFDTLPSPFDPTLWEPPKPKVNLFLDEKARPRRAKDGALVGWPPPGRFDDAERLLDRLEGKQ